MLKFNTDSQFDVSTCHATIGVICRNVQRKLITSITSKIYTYSALVAEALALRAAASLAINIAAPSVLFESDCVVLMEACRGNIIRTDEVIIKDIMNMKVNFTSVGFLWVNREGNMVVDLVAHLPSTNSLHHNLTFAPPASIGALLAADRLACGAVEDQ